MASQAQVPFTATCQSHNKVFQFYCEDDDELACKGCVTDTHRGHTFTELSEHAKKRRLDLKSHLSEMCKVFQRIEDEDQKNDNLIGKMVDHKKFLLQDISTKAEVLKHQVNHVKSNLVDEVNNIYKVDRNMVLNCKQIMKGESEKLKKNIETVKKQISNNDIDMLMFISNYNFDLPNSDSVRMTIGKPLEHMFSSLQVDEKRLQRMIGKIGPSNKISRDHVCMADEFKMKNFKVNSRINFSSSVSNSKHIGTLFPVHGQLSWIGFQRPGVLKLVSLNGSEKMSMNVDFVFKDMKITTYGDVLMSEDKGCKVWKYTFLGRQMEFYDAKTFTTRCMEITKNGEILLCLQKGDSDGKVIKLSPNGNMISEYISDTGGNVLFQKPDRIHESTNGDILVIDWASKHVLGLHPEFKSIKFVYNGTGVSNAKPFTPYDVTTDKLGHIYVPDYENHNIHVLKSDGSFLTLIQCKEFQSNWPRRAAVDSNGFLWVGCNDALLYTINLKVLGLQL